MVDKKKTKVKENHKEESGLAKLDFKAGSPILNVLPKAFEITTFPKEFAGKYSITGKTINSSDKNTTPIEFGKIIITKNFLIQGNIMYGSGTNYNEEESAKWEGKIEFPNENSVLGAEILISETLPNFSSQFIYRGTLNSLTQVTGNYKYTTSNAKGTFEWNLTRLTEDEGENDVNWIKTCSFSLLDYYFSLDNRIYFNLIFEFAKKNERLEELLSICRVPSYYFSIYLKDVDQTKNEIEKSKKKNDNNNDFLNYPLSILSLP